jgi:hypothetical protein
MPLCCLPSSREISKVTADPRHRPCGPLTSHAAELCREDCVAKRWAVLTSNALLFSKSSSSNKKKTWPLHHRCVILPETGVQSRTCTVLHSRYMVLSLSYKNSKQNLVCPSKRGYHGDRLPPLPVAFSGHGGQHQAAYFTCIQQFAQLGQASSRALHAQRQKHS